MAQHDMNIANQGFPAFRSDLNDALAALVSNSSGATAPSTTFAHQMWVDTAADPSILKIRNADNDAWITIGQIDQTGDKFNLTCANATISENLTLNAQGDLRFADSDSSNWVAFQAPATVASNVTWTLPSADGTSGQALTTDGAGTLSWAAGSPEGSYSFRNRIINGDMRIDQRNAGASVTPTDGAYVLDRWKQFASQASKYSVQRNAGSVTPPAGFTNYLGVTSLSAYSVTSSDYFSINQIIEGFNAADLGFGTANAKTVTLSFWVRSSLTGTFGGSLRNQATNRSYPFTYTISSANTWEYKSVTIPGDTSGSWATDNSGSVNVFFSLGAGSNFSGTADAWNSNNNISATGATSVVGTNGATFYITGVQLEVGSVATPFERRPYGTELSLCQRYCVNYRSADSAAVYCRYGTGQSYTTTAMEIIMHYPVPMRATPTLTTTGTASNYGVYESDTVRAVSVAPTLNANSSFLTAAIGASVASGLGVGRASSLLSNNNNTSYLLFSAEL